jgi:agmatinase
MKTSMRGPEGRVNRGWVGVPTFLRAPYCADISDVDADIAVMGVPYDEGSPYLPGSRMGPRALREHSMRFGAAGRLFDPTRGRTYLERELKGDRIVDIGDADIKPSAPDATFAGVTEMTRAILDKGLFPVALGGDHTISYPVVRAHDEDIHIVHFDAHMDYADHVAGMTYTNGQPFRLIHALPNVKGMTQIGIRSLRTSRDDYEDALAAGSEIVPPPRMRDLGPEGVADLVPAGAKVYVSIDVDALDATLIPGCVSAEPNGLTYAELRDCFAAICGRNELVGFDFVEVCPPLDVGTGATSYLGAHVLVECLGLICASDWWKARVGG